MIQRLKYTELAPTGVAAMRSLEHYCNAETLLDPVLLELVRLRASHLNGCEYCVGMHTHELRKHNETPSRIARTADPAGFDGYTHRELAALAWTEAVTNIQQGHADDEAYIAVREHFNEQDLVNLTLAIVSINSWNRMAIAFRAEHRGTPQPTLPTQASAADQPAADQPAADQPDERHAEPEPAQLTSPGTEAAQAAGANQQPAVPPEPQQAEHSAVGDDGGKVAVDE